ncbi:5'-nucleotidase [Enterococcus florum]|uniref:5'-nucleotidase n=1 Tax=Enterococcus florum TaxID=2480627 RepID=A0A4P5PGJ6_9ENTE|nr:HAD-IA family hydrolase [Enterococcus florum]GCF95894.1 5'-nucleotidase [Enterococcus florum]
MKKIVLFDLDGTLTDSSEGILASIRYMMEKLELVIPDDRVLKSFIGPPLTASLSELYGMAAEEAERAIEVYREYYAEKGIQQLHVYPEIPELLQQLSHSCIVGLATSKPQKFAEQIMEITGLSPFFTGFFGADMRGRDSKSDVIRRAIKQLATENSEVFMVGDRKYDILGAKNNGISSIGVLYGFGDRSELEAAGADWIIETPTDLYPIIEQ